MAARDLIPISLDSILMPMMDKGRTQVTWAGIVSEEHKRHPQMTIRDLHKLVVQACLGGDHLLRNPDTFANALALEWDGLLIESSRERALQLIHPSGRVARIHLGPCKAMGLPLRDVSRLLLSQPLKSGYREACDWSWATLLHSSRSGEIPFSYEQLALLQPSDEVTHHSPDYGPAAYRILNDLGHGPTRESLCRLGVL